MKPGGEIRPAPRSRRMLSEDLPTARAVSSADVIASAIRTIASGEPDMLVIRRPRGWGHRYRPREDERRGHQRVANHGSRPNKTAKASTRTTSLSRGIVPRSLIFASVGRDDGDQGYWRSFSDVGRKA